MKGQAQANSKHFSKRYKPVMFQCLAFVAGWGYSGGNPKKGGTQWVTSNS
jgi:hypothetical protein